MLGAAVIAPCSVKLVLNNNWCFCYYCDAGPAAVIDFVVDFGGH
jgi:hypothetical protein